MRQRPKLHEKKLKSGLKSRDSVLCGANVGTTKRKRPKIPYFRTAACRSKFKGHVIQPPRKRRRSPDQTASIAKGMAELHLPFLSSAESCSLSTAEILQKLRWSTIEVPLVKDDAWPGAKLSPHQKHLACSKCTRPDWSALPTARPDSAIHTYVRHLYRVGRYGPGLQIPRDWPLFSPVNWGQNHIFPPLTDSSGVWTPDHRSPMCVREGQEFAVRQEARIQCHMRSIQQPRARMQWQFMEAMRPSWFKWRLQTERRSKRCPTHRNFGLPDCNQSSLNTDIWPQTAMSAFLRPLRSPTNAYSPAVVFLSETHTASETGRLIMDVVATDAFPSQSRESLSWPLPLSQGMQVPIIDYTCRARHVSLGQNQKFRPLLFAAQSRREGTRQAIEQLALAFQPMMTLFTLYYLDTRTDAGEPMPHWMVLFGAVYNENGLFLQAYHPSFDITVAPLEGSNHVSGWGGHTFELCCEQYLHYGMTKEQWGRGPSLEILRTIQGHCNVVLEHLQQWDGYDRACERIFLAST